MLTWMLFGVSILGFALGWLACWALLRDMRPVNRESGK